MYATNKVRDAEARFLSNNGRYATKAVLPGELYDLFVEETTVQPGESGSHRYREPSLNPAGIEVVPGDVLEVTLE